MRNWINLIESATPFEWNGKTIVWSNDEYFISVDDLDDANYVVAWSKDNKRIGFLSTRGNIGVPGYLGIATADLARAHRGQGLGLELYKALLNHLGPRYKGIASYQPDVVNKKQVPAIYKRLGGYPLPNNPDVIVIDKS